MPVEHLAPIKTPTKSPCPECGAYGNEQFYREHIARLNALLADLRQRLESQRLKYYNLQEQETSENFEKKLNLDRIAMVDIAKFRDRIIAAGLEDK